MKRTLLRLAPAAFACLAISCSSKTDVVVTPIPAGSTCPNGGVSIQVSGGTPEVVCNGTNGSNGSTGATGGTGATGSSGATGASGSSGSTGSDGFSTLVVTTAVGPGVGNCPNGGEEIQSGLDDGVDGGTAGDGILQSGEITSTTFICSAAGGDGYIVGSTAPPGGPAGTSTINATGGISDGGPADSGPGTGGNGGQVDLVFQVGTLGGHLLVFNTGSADAGFTFPVQPNFNPGAVPVSITSDTTVDVQSSLVLSDAGPGALYIDELGELNVLLFPEDGGSALATSLTVASNVTFTRTNNPDDVGQSQASISVSGPCFNSGNLALQSSSDSPTLNLAIRCTSYWGDVDSSISNNGVNGAEEGARKPAILGDGTSSGGILVQTEAFWNQGTLSAIGGTGGNGGSGGPIAVNYQQGDYGVPLYNSGAINSYGGAASAGTGGNGGSFSFSMPGDINNSGPINTYGGTGSGSNASGGSGGSIILSISDTSIGSIRNSAEINSSGGNVDSSCTYSNVDDVSVNCQAGNGGSLTFTSQNGTLITSGAITTAGGTSVTGYGGNGAMICLFDYATGDSINWGEPGITQSGDLRVSGNLNTSGGAGAEQGGNAGRVGATLNPNLQPDGQEIIFYGYAKIDVSGGAGAGAPGQAGEIQMNNAYFFVNDSNCDGNCCDDCCDDDCGRPHPHARAAQFSGLIGEYGPGGSVINYANLVANGGSSPVANGGSAGYINLMTQAQQFFPGDTFEQVINLGSITASGGSGAQGGSGDEVDMYGISGTSNSGTIVANGGVGSATFGASAAGIYLSSDNGPLTSAGPITVNGATGVVNGGSGGRIYLSGTTTTVSGTLNSNGAIGSSSGANGGNGGIIDILSILGGMSSVQVAAPAGISVVGGLGGVTGSTGSSGEVIVDGWDQTNLWTH